ncbi:uncharacterized protein LOC121652061 [Melanotaenia boesemani]|uniref:uncharacterized protein LOC121652061 n=1 Tax=Melanotaenia boesemani TaxID=1250792 RepID=UPI001C05C7FB|nr:uncharacterized protein LOC121652061 [Melanotaenia boesemani]
MTQMILFITVLLVPYATQSNPEIQAKCNDDVSLPCPAVTSDDMDFLSLAWYKTGYNKRDGIIRKNKDDNITLRYSLNSSAEFGERHSLRLHNVMPIDSGTYECTISANVGGQNGKGSVKLNVYECVTQTEMVTQITHTWKTTTSNPVAVKDLPVVWTSMGYMVLAVAKIIMSLTAIWVICLEDNRRGGETI